MKKLLLVLAAAAVAAVTLTGAASAGGWATVGLSSLPPGGLEANQNWPVDITVLQHGQTPLAGVTPIVRVRDGGGKVVQSFTAVPTGKIGVYHADVTFPGEGTYSYEVYDGFGTYGGARTHTFKPVAIGGSDGGFPYGWLALALGVALALAAATVLTLRRRIPEPQPIHLKEAA
ncbi:MAG TPA: hypothetical protein VNP89_01385 [Gaiellaceae bacterium]|nr:hypothetical protein [Gaiellaceae bacterium]